MCQYTWEGWQYASSKPAENLCLNREICQERKKVSGITGVNAVAWQHVRPPPPNRLKGLPWPWPRPWRPLGAVSCHCSSCRRWCWLSTSSPPTWSNLLSPAPPEKLFSPVQKNMFLPLINISMTVLISITTTFSFCCFNKSLISIYYKMTGR